MPNKYEVEVGGRTLSFELDRVAFQASGAVLVRYGESTVLVTATMSEKPREGVDFLPLTCDYQEMAYAAGRIPGGFFRREIGRPSEKETLTSRLIDRPMRPLFPKGWNREIQIIATVLSSDLDTDSDMPALNGAAVALAVSDIPFCGPVAAVRVGKVDGHLLINPTNTQLKESTLNLIVAGAPQGLVMVEGGAKTASEDEVLEALFFAHDQMQPIFDLITKIGKEKGKAKAAVPRPRTTATCPSALPSSAPSACWPRLSHPVKKDRYRAVDQAKEEVLAELGEEVIGREKQFTVFWATFKKGWSGKRCTGKGAEWTAAASPRSGPSPARLICCPAPTARRSSPGVKPRPWRWRLWAPLRTSSASRASSGETFKSFMLHYNFPPYSVGETRFLRGPGRREIGHGALAERAISQVLPSNEEFPYTIRIVSEVLSSNGSSSMATVCGASLALMDAGVPIKAAVAGVAMGLMKEGDEVAVLSDILGDEDALGDMDFKVAGTSDGITAVQMDIKMSGLTREVLAKALIQAKEARLHILGKMNEVIASPSPGLKDHAPKIVVININPDKIRDVIGPGGKMIKHIVAQTGVKIDIDDDGRVHISSPTQHQADEAIKIIKELTAEAEIGAIYKGKVKKIMDFGAFVEIIPNTDGLVHISELAHHRVKAVTDILKEGDEVMVKVLDVDRQGKIRLSRKALLEGGPEEGESSESPSHGKRPDRDHVSKKRSD